MSKRFIDPRWYEDLMSNELVYWKGGEVEVGEKLPLKNILRIPESALHTLLPYLFDKGYLNTFLTKQSRDEDLKIVHRLFDLLEAKKDG